MPEQCHHLSLLVLSPKHLTHTHFFPPLSQGTVFFCVDSKLTFKHPLLSRVIHLYTAPVFFLNHQNCYGHSCLKPFNYISLLFGDNV